MYPIRADHAAVAICIYAIIQNANVLSTIKTEKCENNATS